MYLWISEFILEFVVALLVIVLLAMQRLKILVVRIAQLTLLASYDFVLNKNIQMIGFFFFLVLFNVYKERRLRLVTFVYLFVQSTSLPDH
jgi:hypothetical protein